MPLQTEHRHLVPTLPTKPKASQLGEPRHPRTDPGKDRGRNGSNPVQPILTGGVALTKRIRRTPIKREQPKPILCGICGADMCYDAETQIWWCTRPSCKAQTWVDGQTIQGEMEPVLVDRLIRRTFHEDIRTGFVPGKKRGGSKSGRMRKKPKKKPEFYYPV